MYLRYRWRYIYLKVSSIYYNKMLNKPLVYKKSKYVYYVVFNIKMSLYEHCIQSL